MKIKPIPIAIGAIRIYDEFLCQMVGSREQDEVGYLEYKALIYKEKNDYTIEFLFKYPYQTEPELISLGFENNNNPSMSLVDIYIVKIGYKRYLMQAILILDSGNFEDLIIADVVGQFRGNMDNFSDLIEL